MIRLIESPGRLLIHFTGESGKIVLLLFATVGGSGSVKSVIVK